MEKRDNGYARCTLTDTMEGWDVGYSNNTLTGPTMRLPPNLNLHFKHTRGHLKQMNVYMSETIPERAGLKWQFMAVDPKTWTPWNALGPVTKWIDENIGECPATGHVVINTRDNIVAGYITVAGR
jgi:hypothetical protein